MPPRGPVALTEKVVLVTSMLLWEMPPLRLPGMPPPCCFFWLLTMASMEWLRTRMALCREEGRGPERWGPARRLPLPSWRRLWTEPSACAHSHTLRPPRATEEQRAHRQTVKCPGGDTQDDQSCHSMGTDRTAKIEVAKPMTGMGLGGDNAPSDHSAGLCCSGTRTKRSGHSEDS